MTWDGDQDKIRGDGRIPVIKIEAENLAKATHKAIIACHEHGARIETPKQQKGMTLGYDAHITAKITNPDSEPKIYDPGIVEDPRGIMQYILEVTHGIHNHWKKNKEHPEWWGYTYNERFAHQLPFVFQRIKADWEKSLKKEGAGRISGRDYHFSTWIAGEDIILEQEDPPCLQLGNIKFLRDSNGECVMNYMTTWRSRDLQKAWNENNIGQIELMKLIRDKTSDMLQIPIKLGAYIDTSTSLHLYGLYIDRDNLEQTIKNMKRDGWKKRSRSLEDYIGDREKLKKLISSQSIAEQLGHGLNQPEQTLKELGFNLEKFPYPEEWDTWPKSWDAAPDITKLARVF